MQQQNVNKTFKILSFFAIYFVVSGHVVHGGVQLAYDWFTLYSFHIPLFLFISGYFYKDSAEGNPLAYIWKKFKRLMIPMYVWNLVYGIFTQILHSGFGFNFLYWQPLSLKSLLILPLNYGHQFALNLATWFVFPLFCVEVFNMLFRKLCGLLKLKNEYVFTVLYLAIGVAGILLSRGRCAEDTASWWLALTRVMFLLPFYQIGTLYNRKLEKHDHAPNVLYFGIIFILQLAVILYSGTNNSLIYLAVWMTGFNHGLAVPFLSSILGIAFWLRVAKLLTPGLGDSRTVRYVADNTFSVMTHHLLGFLVLNLILLNVNKVLPLNNFAIYAVFTNAMYNWYPEDNRIFSIVYVFFGFGMSLLTAFLVSKLKAAAGRLIKKPE